MWVLPGTLGGNLVALSARLSHLSRWPCTSAHRPFDHLRRHLHVVGRLHRRQPQVFPRPPWHFTNVQVGLAFLAAAVGALIGKFAGGYVSDWTVNFFVRRNSNGSLDGKRVPECTVSGRYSARGSAHHRPAALRHRLRQGDGLAVEVIGGIGVYYVANSAAGGILQTYIIESYITKAVHGIALFNFVKCCLAFSVPSSFPSGRLRASQRRTSCRRS